MVDYQPLSTNQHGRDEELQWARLLSTGEAAQGMALVVIQKLCTAFHEFAPAWRAGGLNEQQLPFFRSRLAARTRRVLDVMALNGLDALDGVAELKGLLQTIESAPTLAQLANLAETIHAVDHRLTDALEESCQVPQGMSPEP